jgi:sialic acid synthase SpsE
VCLAAEAPNLAASRRSLAARCDLGAGHVLEPGDLVALRPATGIPPFNLDVVIGRPLLRPLSKGEALTHGHLERLLRSEADRVA